jgi:hypothetical protein
MGAWGFGSYNQPWLPPVVLTGMMFITLMIILIVLKRRDAI